MADGNKTPAIRRAYKTGRWKSNLIETTAIGLAARRAAEPGAHIVGTPIVSTKHPVVAVIDDNLNVLDSMTRLLATHGFDVELYVSPNKFFESVMTTQATCLVVDVRVADGCGVEFVRQLVSLGITFPVIFIGASDNDEVERRAIGMGCVAFFREPLSAYLLVEALYDLADSYSARRPGH